MNKLELTQVIEQRDALLDTLTKINGIIKDQQIVKESDMNLFGFQKLTEGSKIVIYGKQLEDGAVYEIILDLTMPSLVAIHRGKQQKSYGFEIATVEEFRELLIFGNLL